MHRKGVRQHAHNVALMDYRLIAQNLFSARISQYHRSLFVVGPNAPHRVKGESPGAEQRGEERRLRRIAVLHHHAPTPAHLAVLFSHNDP